MKKKLNAIYKKIKLFFVKNMFKSIKGKEDNLTSTEYFCLECISLLENPTISQFADFLEISSPNATYKVKTLIKKGYIKKEKSQKDGREYILVPTEKYYGLFENSNEVENIKELKTNLNKAESKKVEKIMKILVEKN